MKFGRIEATGGFFLLFAWLNYWDRHSVVPLGMLACAVHELGHYGAIRLLGGDIRQIRLTAVGAEMVMARPLNYWQEGIAALAGPGVNLMLALLLSHWDSCPVFVGLNLVLGCFNMMPVGRLDGGRVLYGTLALLVGPELAQWTEKGLSVLFTGAFFAAGVLAAFAWGNLTLLLVAGWMAAAFIPGKRGEIGLVRPSGKR